MTTLNQLAPGDRGAIREIRGEPALVQRLMELGLLEGEEIEVVAFAPLGDPMEIRCGNTRLSLRCREAAGIEIAPGHR